MINFFTDPHLGLSARTNTSASSSKALDAKLTKVALSVAHTYDNLVCVGDLFHRSHNKESVILEAVEVAANCDIVVGGNHDMINRTDDVPSLELVTKVCDSVLKCKTGEVQVYSGLEFETGEVLCVIPHHATQELFDQAVDLACQSSGDIVVLHCNYNNPFVQDIDTALNLSPLQAEKLLKSFSYIVLGHEHMHRWEMDGRLLVLGNTHPTGFGDISDKFVWHFDKKKANPWSQTKIWDKFTGELTLAANEIYDLPESEFLLDGEAVAPQFVSIVGDLPAEDIPELASRIGLIWKHWKPFMVRNVVNSIVEETTSLMEEGYRIEDFSSKIKSGLVSSEKLLKKFNQELDKVGEE